MDHAEHRALLVADMRSILGAAKLVITASELAIYLGKSRDAIYASISRGGIPVPLIPGTKTMSIFAVADWMAGGTVKEKVNDKTNPPPVPAPKRKRFDALLRSVADQREFLFEFYAELERISIEEDTREAEDDDRNPNP